MYNPFTLAAGFLLYVLIGILFMVAMLLWQKKKHKQITLKFYHCCVLTVFWPIIMPTMLIVETIISSVKPSDNTMKLDNNK